ncbi:glycosyltransferase [Accumulibacter sp.]|uniref:glycosyltransferase n=1 Tax=Accumulibacter sp. TaxID=2053492 RepID=UPI002D1FACBF|nr:glycosyltransferase [Accumulibacter sp.]
MLQLMMLKLITFSSLFPSAVRPNAGLFVRERMGRVAQRIPLVVVAPQAWFPFQGIIRWFRPHFRPMAVRYEQMGALEIFRPYYLSVPGILKDFDGLSMALCSYRTVRRLQRQTGASVLDVHFGYPDGYAGSLLARWLGLKFVVTFRGNEDRTSRTSRRKHLMRCARSADLLIGVSEQLRALGESLGAPSERTCVVGNGVDLSKFRPIPRGEARAALGLPADVPLLITVGGLVERKGFHRVIEVLPKLIARHPGLRYLVVGGGSPEGDNSAELRAQVERLALQDSVVFCGPVAPERLHVYYSAANVFALATRFEGWANVFLEAMACGLPVVTTLVGGNAQVVCDARLGLLVPFGEPAELEAALDQALQRAWDAAYLRTYAENNAWDSRIELLVRHFHAVSAGNPSLTSPHA